jgi:outer membrane lipoprotein-sorting protein
MIRSETIGVISLCLALASFSGAQRAKTGRAEPAQAPRRDPAALAALAQMAATTGWNPLNLPTDAVVSGTLTLASGSNLTVTYKMRGLGQYRSDVQNGTSLTSTVVSNGQMAITFPDGTSRYLGLQDVVSTWPVTVPVFSRLADAAALQDLSVSYLGLETVDSSPCNKIQISTNIQPVDPVTVIESATASITVWLDAASGVPVQLQYTRLASDGSTASVSRTRKFSNYQPVNGMLVAFTQQEFGNGQPLYTVQLSAANFNVGLTDADFALLNVQ